MGFKNIMGQLARWLEELAMYDMDIIHRPGKQHANADGLSRLKDDITPCNCYFAGQGINDLPCGGCRFCKRAHEQWGRFHDEVDDIVPLAVTQVRTVQLGSRVGEQEVADGTAWCQLIPKETIRGQQQGDPDIAAVMKWAQDGVDLTQAELARSGPSVKYFWLVREQLSLRDGVLYYKWEEAPPRWLLVVPKELKQMVMESNIGQGQADRHLAWYEGGLL